MKTVLILSGGMDSTVLLHWLLRRGDEVSTLSFDYGQRHRKELDFAAASAIGAGVPYDLVDLSGIGRLLGGSSQTDPGVPVPEGHYTEESMKATVVPNRNMIMLAVAGGVAIARKAGRVAYAAHSGDHAIYPDCREEFVRAMDAALGLADWSLVSVDRPFVGMTKAEIARVGATFGVDFSKTWSCYKGGKLHCGKCGTCVERREAFALAGLNDPTQYEQGG